MKLSRRSLIAWLGAVMASIAAACGLKTDGPGGEEGLPVTPSRPILTNENSPAIKPHWNVRFIRPFEALDRDRWRLKIEGLVERPLELGLAEIQALPSIVQNSRLVCVEGWSSRAEWVGFTFQTLVDLVKPKPEAQWVYFECADGYYEVLSLAELLQPRVLFAYKMDGELLPDKFGAPLRLIMPDRYGYKGPKTILKMRFQEKGGRGYWSTVGPYTRDGVIEPGVDRPLDLGGRREIKGGEVTEY
jgi:sulfoxide reductase catalytic subunit YedY